MMAREHLVTDGGALGERPVVVCTVCEKRDPDMVRLTAGPPRLAYFGICQGLHTAAKCDHPAHVEPIGGWSPSSRPGD